ncbi:MAG: polyribonucleotide nucleotidyltransferase, partial [Candidatus Brennerbacteria bacterium CG23_combo_of_CG06-09_8_20_14_all_44_41]
MSSNGSTSMASVCGTSLALMDAGVPIKKHVAGISIGLMSNASGDYVLLTDIQGPEDHYGDMDCKIAGTRDGITAMQMDVKVEGITPEILKQALDRAQQARMLILDVMEKTIACPRSELSIYAPRVIIMHISKDK